MPIRRILIENIRYKRRLREVNNERVLALANSIDAIGLQVPVTVYKEEDGEYVLVAGLHRLKAAQRLGWDYVSAEITSLDELDRKLCGIDENLCRAELTALERAQHLQLRQEIWSARRSSGQTSPETAPGVGRAKGFATTTEQATGIPKRTINQDIRRADEILADFQSRIADTRIAESGVELEALASARPEQQREAVQKVLSSEAETVREIIVSPGRTPGGQRRFSELAISTTLMLGVVFRLPLRQTEGFVRSLVDLMGCDLPVPDHTTLSR